MSVAGWIAGPGGMADNAGGRMIEDFNKGWLFYWGDVPEAKEAAFDDAGWRMVRLPHDWSIEQSFSEENTAA